MRVEVREYAKSIKIHSTREREKESESDKDRKRGGEEDREREYMCVKERNRVSACV